MRPANCISKARGALPERLLGLYDFTILSGEKSTLLVLGGGSKVVGLRVGALDAKGGFGDR
jgi:hypothetical protein